MTPPAEDNALKLRIAQLESSVSALWMLMRYENAMSSEEIDKFREFLERKMDEWIEQFGHGNPG